MERDNNSAHAQHLDGVVCRLFQQYGPGNYRLYHSGAAGNFAFNPEADSPNAPDERIAAQDAGDSGTPQRRPESHFPGDHEALPGVGSKPGRLPGAADSAAPHPDWAVPGVDSNPFYQARGPGRAFPKAVSLDNLCADSFGSAPERPILVAEVGRAGSLSRRLAHIGRCLYLGTAENDHDPFAGSTPAVQPEYDALDDPYFPGLFLPAMAQWTAPVLDCVQCNRRRDSILHNRMGALVPVDTQVGRGIAPAIPVSRKQVGFRGDRERWSQSREPPEPQKKPKNWR